MTFLNASLALGAIACVVPLVIHLLNRRRFNVVQWGAMHLIAPLVRTNRRRIRLEQLILLLLRMAILALLALCMAGPVLTGWHALSGNAKTSLSLVFDNSYSMQAGAVGATNLEQAKRDAARLIEHQPRGSDVIVSLMAGGKMFGSVTPTSNRRRAAESIAGLPTGYGTADVREAFEHATRSLVRMQHAKRDLVVVSDFQSKDWSGDAAPALRQATELINALPIRPTVTLMNIGRETTDNVSVQSIELSPSVVATDQQVSIRVNLCNHSDVPFPRIEVHLQVDGNDRYSETIDLGGGEDGQLLFQHTFQEAGSHVINVRADADTLGIDNGFLAVVQVWDRLPVLLVDGDPSTETLKSETGFLQLALSPFMAASRLPGDGPDETLPRADLLAATTVPVAQLNADRLSDARVLVLANVERLDAGQLDAVKSFVREGNSLLVFPGDKTDVAWYRSQMCVDAGLIPMTFEQLRSPSVDAGRKAATPVDREAAPVDGDGQEPVGAKIAGTRFDHPALEFFNDSRNGKLAEATVRRWYRLSKPGSAIRQQLSSRSDEESLAQLAALSASTSVVARLDIDDPFLVENEFGNGRVMVCATSCDDDWSNLPSRPFYLPLMQRLVTYLAIAVEPRRNLTVGQTIVAHVRGDAGDPVLTRPDGRQVELDEDNRGEFGVVEYADTDLEGLYTLQMSALPPLQYAVIAPRSESDLTRLDDEEMTSLAESMQATVVQSTEDFIQQDSTRRYGREIWRQLFWAMLALVVAEVVLEQLFAGVPLRQAGGAS